MTLRLYSYWRSSAAYRVRIALNLKDLPYELVPVHLVKDGGQHHLPDFVSLNPQHFVPVLTDGDRVFRQSQAIIEYLDESYEGQQLIPADSRSRARVRMLAQMIACDIHPLNNLRVLRYLENELGVDAPGRGRWYQHWIAEGFAALEALLADSPLTGDYCDGDEPTLADIFLVPQVYNAIRLECPLRPYATIRRIYTRCIAEEAFFAASPERQPDAET